MDDLVEIFIIFTFVAIAMWFITPLIKKYVKHMMALEQARHALLIKMLEELHSKRD